MKEYIKKFESAASADNYEITDIPFTTTISGNPAQNLRCNVEGKKLVNDNGTVSVQDGIRLISFTINGYQYQAESGMTWRNLVENKTYNTDGFHRAANLIFPASGNNAVEYNGVYVETGDNINANYAYTYEVNSGGYNTYN